MIGSSAKDRYGTRKTSRGRKSTIDKGAPDFTKGPWHNWAAYACNFRRCQRVLRDKYKDSADAIDFAESVFLLKHDTIKILGEMWQLSNPPEPRKRGDTARFTILTPIDSDTNDYLDSASRLVEKLPEHDKLMQQIATIRDHDNQLIRDAKNLYDHYPLNVLRQGEYRVNVVFNKRTSIKRGEQGHLCCCALELLSR